MKFFKGTLRPYKDLRTLSPSIYYLENFCFKVLTLHVREDRNIFVEGQNVTQERSITLNFPEYLEVSSNLGLIKDVHYAYDVFFGDSLSSLVKLGFENTVGGSSKLIRSFPEGMLRLYFGYAYVPVRDPNEQLEEIQALCCKKLAEMEDDCFIWTEVGEKFPTTYKPTVCKYKVVLDVSSFLRWLQESTLLGSALTVNFICHPPYQSRMSFKDNIKILYPQKTMKFKMLDKVSFRTNKSYLKNSKLYEVLFIDKDTDEVLYQYNSAKHSSLFTAVIKDVDNSQINSYIHEDIRTFEDGIVVDFNIPSAIQPFLSEHRNYKIRIISRDLTTKEESP